VVTVAICLVCCWADGMLLWWCAAAVCRVQGYCRAVVAPKVSKFRSKYMSKLMKA
jgi:hypothetical protein